MEHTIQMHAVYIYIFFNRQPNATVYNRYFCVNKRSPRRNFAKCYYLIISKELRSGLSAFLRYVV